jgi:hypothetical protein
MSTLNVDKVDPSSGTALELGTSGDTITVPTGAGLTVVDEVKTNKVSPATGTAFALGDSGDTFTVPSGATIVNSGTATGFGGGKILQIQSATFTSEEQTSSTSFTATAFTDIITPSATASKIWVVINGGRGSYGGGTAEGVTSLYKEVGGSGGFSEVVSMMEANVNEVGGYGKPTLSFNYLDSPSTTSAIEYKVYYKTNANTFYVNSGNSRVTITLLEVGA